MFYNEIIIEIEIHCMNIIKLSFPGTHDPNYQTLAGVGGDCFGADKAGGGGGGGGGPKAPAAGGIAG